MKDGWWVNYVTGRKVALAWGEQHEHVIRDWSAARRLGVPESVFAQFSRFRPDADRRRFLLWLMKLVPLMRVRGHGVYVSFEYASRTDRKPVEAVGVIARRFGPATLLRVSNLEMRRHRNVLAFRLQKRRKRACGSRSEERE